MKMRNSFLFYPKLATSNIKKNSKTYGPYMVACIVTATIYYLLRSISLNPSLTEVYIGSALHAIMQLGADVSFFFIIIFLFYTNSFLLKQRQKEFAIFNTLGMDKKHISVILAFETLYTLIITVVGGLFFGILLDKLAFLTITKVIHLDTTIHFSISYQAIRHVIFLFGLAFTLIYIKYNWSLHILNPMELLRESKAGEKEPKAKWAVAILGIISLLSGYGIALHYKNPVKAIPAFFIAAILVTIGTFLIFTAGSITLLKILKRNKKFYYKTSHFISVSGLMFRMKQNAKGLASICILSTAVLVMLTSTGSLMRGMKDNLINRYPYSFNFNIGEQSYERTDELIEKVHDLQEQENIPVSKEIKYKYLSIPAVQKNDEFIADMNFTEQSVLMFVPLSDYNKFIGENLELSDGEVLIHTKRLDWTYPKINILGKNFSVKDHIKKYPENGGAISTIWDYLYIVCTDNDFENINILQKDLYGNYCSEPSFFYGFETTASDDDQNEFRPYIRELFNDYNFTCESRVAEEASYTGLFGGLFFVGIFLGLLFIIATILIIYYKQISEGYEDKNRYDILQKVGMSQKEVKKSINSQILIVFFLPLIFSGLHLTVAFPIMKTMLAILGLAQTNIFIVVSIISYLVFSAFYIAIYMFTSRTYYKIVKR